MKELFLLPKFDNSSPSCAYELMTHYLLRQSTKQSPLNEVYLLSKFMFPASLWLKIFRFSNWSFCWLRAVQSWYSFCWLWVGQNWPYSFLFPALDRSQLFYWVWAKQATKNNPNPHRLIKIQELPIGSSKSHFPWFNQSRSGFLSQ